MNINIEKIDLTDFNVVECNFGGDTAVWVYPKLEGVKWNKDNLILRSSIWRKSDGSPISLSFPKFFNWAQEPDIYPPPNALTNKINVVEKLDGSCLIISKYKGELIIRTRRARATTMLNGDEIAMFQLKYPKVFDNPLLDTASLLFEWLTPSNQIVLRYLEPEIKLIGCIDHDTYALASQKELDGYAHNLGVERPKYHKYDTIEDMLQNIADLRGEEGVCVYYGNDQHIRKIKSDWYLSVHNFRNAMNIKNIVDLYFIMDMPDYNKFCEGVLNQFQYEGLLMAKPLISMVCDAMKEVHRILAGMRAFLHTNMNGINYQDKAGRKRIAEKIQEAYGTTNRADILFTMVDLKPVNQNQYKKLLFQSLVKK